MEADLTMISNWMEANKLSINLSKTNYLLFQSKSLPTNYLPYFDHKATKIYQVEKAQYLGLIIDTKLNWSYHINMIKRKITPLIFAIRKIRNYLDEDTCWLMYYAHIQSHLLYLNSVWSNAAKYLIDDLQIMQNKAIKIIKKLPRLTPTMDLYSENLLPLSIMSEYERCLFIQKTKLGLIKCNVDLKLASEHHEHSLRRRSHYYIPHVKSEKSAKNIFVSGLNTYNIIPSRIKSNKTIKNFKTQLKEYLINKWKNI